MEKFVLVVYDSYGVPILTGYRGVLFRVPVDTRVYVNEPVEDLGRGKVHLTSPDPTLKPQRPVSGRSSTRSVGSAE